MCKKCKKVDLPENYVSGSVFWLLPQNNGTESESRDNPELIRRNSGWLLKFLYLGLISSM
jgi:hypothetical protein